MTLPNEMDCVQDPRAVLYWYDFICPFCYVAQSRNAMLTAHGICVVKLPFEAHPDIPASGRIVGPRTGVMYSAIEREAREAGLALRWPARLPNTRMALAMAEWVRRHQPLAFPRLFQDQFEAHFVSGEDLGDAAVLERHARDAGVDVALLRAALADGGVAAAARDAEATARE